MTFALHSQALTRVNLHPHAMLTEAVCPVAAGVQCGGRRPAWSLSVQAGQLAPELELPYDGVTATRAVLQHHVHTAPVYTSLCAGLCPL